MCRGGALKYTSHMNVTSLQLGEITGPDGKVTAGCRHQGRLLGYKEALYAGCDEGMAGVFAQMELTDM